MSRLWLAIVLSLAIGCCSARPQAVTLQQMYPEKPPEDLTGELLDDKTIPTKFKKNYIKWVRYGWNRHNQIKDRPGLLNR